jgi:hypothetical protein
MERKFLLLQKLFEGKVLITIEEYISPMIHFVDYSSYGWFFMWDWIGNFIET